MYIYSATIYQRYSRIPRRTRFVSFLCVSLRFQKTRNTKFALVLLLRSGTLLRFSLPLGYETSNHSSYSSILNFCCCCFSFLSLLIPLVLVSSLMRDRHYFDFSLVYKLFWFLRLTSVCAPGSTCAFLRKSLRTANLALTLPFFFRRSCT